MQLIQICFESAGKGEMHLTVAFSLSLKTYGARGQVLKSAGKLEKTPLPQQIACYPGSYAWSLFQFYVRQKLGVTSRSSEICRAQGKRADPGCLVDHVGFLFVWLSDSGSSCEPRSSVFSRPSVFLVVLSSETGHFRAKHFKFSHRPGGPTALQMS